MYIYIYVYIGVYTHIYTQEVFVALSFSLSPIYMSGIIRSIAFGPYAPNKKMGGGRLGHRLSKLKNLAFWASRL